MWLARWLRFVSALLLAASALAAVMSLVEALREAPVSWVVALVAVACSLLVGGLGLEALAQVARMLVAPSGGRRAGRRSQDDAG